MYQETWWSIVDKLVDFRICLDLVSKSDLPVSCHDEWLVLVSKYAVSPSPSKDQPHRNRELPRTRSLSRTRLPFRDKVWRQQSVQLPLWPSLGHYEGAQTLHVGIGSVHNGRLGAEAGRKQRIGGSFCWIGSHPPYFTKLELWERLECLIQFIHYCRVV